MFHGLRRLETLILSRNAIAFIARDSFTGMSNLHELVLGKNKLTYLKPGAFDGLDNLRTLILNDNGITDLPDSLFAGLKSLSKVVTIIRAIALLYSTIRPTKNSVFYFCLSFSFVFTLSFDLGSALCNSQSR